MLSELLAGFCVLSFRYPEMKNRLAIRPCTICITAGMCKRSTHLRPDIAAIGQCEKQIEVRLKITCLKNLKLRGVAYIA